MNSLKGVEMILFHITQQPFYASLYSHFMPSSHEKIYGVMKSCGAAAPTRPNMLIHRHFFVKSEFHNHYTILL